MLWDRFFNFGIPIDYKVEKSVNQNLLIDQKVEKAFNYLIDDLFFNQLNLSFLTFDFLSHSNFWIDWKIVINSTRMEIIQHKKLIEKNMIDQPKYFRKSKFIREQKSFDS